MIINLDIFNKNSNVDLSDETAIKIYDAFKRYDIECNVENIKWFIEIILNMQIEDINMQLDYDLELELKPNMVIEDINSSIVYEMIQEMKLNCIVEDIQFSANLDMEIKLAIDCTIEDINFQCNTSLIVLRTIDECENITMNDLENMTLDEFYYKEY